MRWRFYPAPFRPEPDQGREERARRGLALRVGSGLGVEFGLAWNTGPDPSLEVEASSPVAVRWLRQVLLPSYGAGRWRPVPPPTSLPGRTRFGLPRNLAPSAAADEESTPWSESVLLALASFPAGLSAQWNLRAAGSPPDPGVPETWPTLVRVPIGYRLETPPPARRSVAERAERDRTLPIWQARLRVRSGTAAAPVAAERRFESLLRLSTSVAGGPRLDFVSPRPWRSRDPPPVLLSESGLLDLLPRTASPLPVLLRPDATVGAGLTLGHGLDGRPVAIALEPHQGRHLAILGETGMGKTTLLLRLALRAVHSGNVVLLDPIGDSGREFLGRLAPSLWPRVLWVSPTDSPIALDLLGALRTGAAGSADSERRLGDLVDALRRVRAGRFADTPFWGPRIEETVRRTLAAAAAIPTASLEDAVRLLDSVGRRPVGVPPEAAAAVDQLRARARERPEEVDGSRRLLQELVDRPILHRMIDQRGARFSASEAFSPGRILVVTGDSSRAGEASARYLLAIYLALLWCERVALPSAPKTFLFLDEAQWFAHESTAEILRLGRRANLHLVLATQSLGSLPETVREAVLTNASDLVVFRGSPSDARDLARLLPGGAPERFWGLGRGSALALLGKGDRVVETLVPRLPPIAPSVTARAIEAAISRSRNHWAAEGNDRETRNVGSRSEPGRSDGPASGPEREILIAIWSELLGHPDVPSLPIRPSDLRERFDPEGSVVRAVGRRLREQGALAGSERDPTGTTWEVRRDGFDRLLGPGVDPRELRDVAARWRADPASPTLLVRPP